MKDKNRKNIYEFETKFFYLTKKYLLISTCKQAIVHILADFFYFYSIFLKIASYLK